MQELLTTLIAFELVSSMNGAVSGKEVDRRDIECKGASPAELVTKGILGEGWMNVQEKIINRINVVVDMINLLGCEEGVRFKGEV